MTRKSKLTIEEIMKLPTKQAIDELMKLYDEPLPTLVIYSHDLIEPKERLKKTLTDFHRVREAEARIEELIEEAREIERAET